jgi:hypothetical protein
VYSKDGYILCSETDVDTEAGPGRADILLLRREATSNGLRAVWRPVLLLDLKSRLGLHWSLGRSEKKSDSREKYGLPLRVVADFNIRTRLLDAKEWESIIGAVPSNSMSKQVRLYADAIVKSYEEIVDEPCPYIPVGTFIVDSETDLRVLRSILRAFVIEVYESLPDTESDTPRIVYQLVPRQDSPRAAIIIHHQVIPFTSNRVPLPPFWKPLYDPLQGAYGSMRRFILNVSGASPTSSGKSAARISRYWHGLQLIREIADEYEGPDIIWLDLADEFTIPSLAAARLRLLPRSSSENNRYRSQPPNICELFETIALHGLHQEIQDYIFRDGKPPQLDAVFRNCDHKLVVVSGWDWVQSGTPEPYRDILNRLLATLMDKIPDDANTTIIWFDSPVPRQDSSPVYSTRTLLPFYQNSPLLGEVTEIIWNLPMAPRSEIWPSDWILPSDPIAPGYDEIRVLIHQTRKGYETTLTQIPTLIGWSNKFRAESSKYSTTRLRSIETTDLVPNPESRKRMKTLSLSLVPWILNLHPSTTTETKLSIELNSESLEETSRSEPTLLERIRLHREGVRGAKAYATLTTGRINSQRSYRSPGELKTKLLSSYKLERTPSISHRGISFGQVITLSQSDSNTDLLVCEDPYNSGRMLIGMFTESSFPNDAGFMWTKLDVSRLREVLDSDPDDIQVRHQIFVKSGNGLCCWEKEPSDSKWSAVGDIELVSRQGGRFAVLSGIRVIPDSLVDAEEPTDRFPDNFDARTKSVLEKVTKSMEQTQSVSVKLMEDEFLCEIAFVDSVDNEVIHSEIVQGTCDVISLLRYPITIKNALKTPSGHLLTWNPFNDIEYGKFDDIRSLVETTAPKDVGKSVAPFFTDILESADAIVELILKHDSNVCPIINSEDYQHGKCWRLLSQNEDISNIQAISSLLTGREIYGLLATGKIQSNGRVYSIKLNLGHERDEPEFYTYHEETWIRRLLRENGMYLKRLTPGTFIRIPEQRWNLQFIINENVLEWTAVSEVTNLPLEGPVFRHRLNPTFNLEEAVQDILGNINLHVSNNQIANLEAFRMLLKSRLDSCGYGISSPNCQLEVFSEEQILKVKLIQTGGKVPIEVSEETFLFQDNDSRETFLESLYYRLDEGDLSSFNITNTEDFLDKLEEHLTRIL